MAIAIAVLIFSVSISKANDNILAYNEYAASMVVGDHVGFNLDDDKLHFGTMMLNGYSKRGLIINSTSQEGYLYVTSQGKMDNMLYIDSAPKIIYKNQPQNIDFYAVADDNEGAYESIIRVYVLKSDSNFFKVFLKGKPVKIINSDEDLKEKTPKISLVIPEPNETKE